MRVVLSPEARRDVRAALRWSELKFGLDAKLRYESLIGQAIRDLQADPNRPGSTERRDAMIDGARTYHIRLSRDRARTALGVVHNPRHFIIYRRRVHDENVIEVARILRDDRDLVLHLPLSYRRED
jgi:toxin ParE1/3/4